MSFVTALVLTFIVVELVDRVTESTTRKIAANYNIPRETRVRQVKQAGWAGGAAIVLIVALIWWIAY